MGYYCECTLFANSINPVLIALQAGLYYVDGGKETADLIDSTGEPWRPLSEFIIKENPHVRDRTKVEIQDMIQARDKYRAEYASSQLCLSAYQKYYRSPYFWLLN